MFHAKIHHYDPEEYQSVTMKENLLKNEVDGVQKKGKPFKFWQKLTIIQN